MAEDGAELIKHKLLPLAASQYRAMPKNPHFAPVLTPSHNKAEYEWPTKCCACHQYEDKYGGNEVVILNGDTICQACRVSMGIKMMKKPTIGAKRSADQQ